MKEISYSWRSKAALRGGVVLIIALISLYGVLPLLHLHGFSIRPKEIRFAVPAVILMLLTFVCSALTYQLLTQYRLNFYRTLLVQFASVPMNRLLPAGVGNIGLNYLYLRKNHQNKTMSGLVVLLNNFLGIIANCLMLIIIILLYGIGGKYPQFFNQHLKASEYGAIGLITIFIFTLYFFGVHYRRLIEFKVQLKLFYRHYSSRPLAVPLVLFLSGALALINAAALWFCLMAYGINFSLASVFIIYSLSVLVGTLTPTPGGIGGVEAALSAGVVAAGSGINTAYALSAVLFYRIITYWLPFILGAACLFIVEKQRMIRLDLKVS